MRRESHPTPDNVRRFTFITSLFLKVCYYNGKSTLEGSAMGILSMFRSWVWERNPTPQKPTNTKEVEMRDREPEEPREIKIRYRWHGGRKKVLEDAEGSIFKIKQEVEKATSVTLGVVMEPGFSLQFQDNPAANPQKPWCKDDPAIPPLVIAVEEGDRLFNQELFFRRPNLAAAHDAIEAVRHELTASESTRKSGSIAARSWITPRCSKSGHGFINLLPHTRFQGAGFPAPFFNLKAALTGRLVAMTINELLDDIWTISEK
jgi:hypothetical protein